MAQKINWSTVIVSAVVAVVVTLITVSVMGNVALSPVNQPSVGGSGIINAHKCMADQTCETNGLLVQKNAFIGESAGIFPENSNGNLAVGGDLHLAEDSIECDSFVYEEGTGDQTCQQNGYDFCVSAEYGTKVSYYDSVNGSCSGNLQMVVESSSVGKCPEFSGGGGGGCGLLVGGVEPYYGDRDVFHSGVPGEVLCCK